MIFNILKKSYMKKRKSRLTGKEYSVIPTTIVTVISRGKKGNPDRVLLGIKRTGLGKSMYNTAGGKIGDKSEFIGETPKEGAVRELKEEWEIDAKSISPAGVVYFLTEGSDTAIFSYIFLVDEWKGDPKPTDELTAEWFDIKDIPYGQMWPTDKEWLPRVLNGEQIDAEFHFYSEGKGVQEFEFY